MDRVFIIDNASTDGTPDFLQNQRFLANNKIEHIRMSENTGSAGGFHTGIKRAYEWGADWIWMMDDDGYAEKTVCVN